ncbi:capsular polysaccharide synthesis protein [Pedobacter sp. UBA4863]|uniref:capsular polysaccharide synthesis protein n=1 Tax=Pedobacter sp. UBA4863 TaxID=1947060 RepID=UPI0025E2F14A|nr:capsular polysaccharide synthesis protein [Pedobacter sp. UBA4863]
MNIKYFADKVWGSIRNQIVGRRHKRIAKFWQPILSDYFEGKIEKSPMRPKKQIEGKVIWQYWGQQTDDQAVLPATVQRCFNSVDKYKGDYQVIRLNDKTIGDYLDFPEFVWQAENESKFSRVFFSDLLRLALLHVYGGVWLDATILLTAPLSKEYTNQQYFVFQRCQTEPNKSFWAGPHTSYWSWDPRYRVKMLNSVIFAQKGSVMIATMFDLILHYWKTQHKIIDYFFFQILYDELVNGKLKHIQCAVVSDTLPHVLRVLVDGNDYMQLSTLLKLVNIHKLTYFDENKIAKLDELIAQAEQLDKS